MRINPITNPNILRSYQASRPAPARAKSESKLDEVSFSDEALSFSKTLAAARDSIEVRTPEENSRIAGIKEAVRQGTYRIDSDKIAEKIFESVIRG